MTKQIIAVDIDDVISAYAKGFVEFSNKRWGTNLKPEDYSEHWTEIWQVDHQEEERRANELYTSGLYDNLRYFPEAKEILKSLTQKYRVVAVTSRRNIISKETKAWLEKYFKDIFEEIHFAGIWDKLDSTAIRIKLTKAEVCKEIGADYLIDDHPKHCIAAAEAGIESLLFGDYSWNQDVKLPSGVTRVKNWQEIADYFHV